MTLAQILVPWLSLALVPQPGVAQQAPDAPPGMILVKGGRTTIGSTSAEVEQLVLAREELSFALAGETPQFKQEVGDFYLMPTEVTNEQYAAFVQATHAKPPRSWGAAVLQAGQAAFVQEQGRARQAAKAEGLPFEVKVFDPEAWWDENWKVVHYEIPKAELAHPVVFVNYADAQRYARWAGLRLMSEFEFQRAARGDSAHVYPWGDPWEDRRFCQSLHSGKDSSQAVGSFPAGASNGLFDLAGNVWEWTASPFDPYPGYHALRFTNKARRVIDCLAPFDPEQRVTVSGSFQMDKLGVRVATRKNTDRTQSTNALGFRCAASPLPGLDAARWIIEQDLQPSAALREAALEPHLSAVLRRWSTGATEVHVPGYALISGYEQILCCPVRDLDAATVADLAKRSEKDGPVFLGLIDLSCPSARPELAAGTYWVAWRGAGKEAVAREARQGIRLDSAGDRASLQEVDGFAADKDCFVFYGRDGLPRAAMQAPPLTVERLHPSSLRIEPFAPDTKAGSRDAGRAPHDTLRISLALTSAINRAKCLVFDLSLEVAAGSAEHGWK